METRNIFCTFPLLLLLASAPLLLLLLLFNPQLLASLHYLVGVIIPSLNDSFSGWLTTPYLFFITNCIILAILAISSLQHTFNWTGQGQNNTRKEINVLTETIDCHEPPVLRAAPAMDEMGTKSPLVLISPCSETRASMVKGIDDKILASARFTSRRNQMGVSLHEGSKSLKVRRHDVEKAREETFESAWKKITEGRRPPLARHLRSTSEGIAKKLSTSMVLERGGSKRKSSAGEDELNKRVEAFIAKFNEDMSLEKQDSLVSYTEMINRGADV